MTARAARKQELTEAGVPADLAASIANLGPIGAAPDIVLVADRTGKPIGEVAATYFATGRSSGSISSRLRLAAIPIADYFDRLALDRARDSIGDAERRLTAAMVGNGTAGAGAVEAWVTPRKSRGRADPRSHPRNRRFGAYLSKLSVAASLLGDLVKN